MPTTPFVICAVDALKRKEVAAHVVKHLDGVAVQCVDLVAQLEKRHHRVRVNFGRSVLQRVDLGRVSQFSDNQAGAIGGHEVSIHPHHIKHDAKVWIGHLRECAVPVVQPTTRRDGQAVKAVVERHQRVGWTSNIAKHSHSSAVGHGHQLGAHDAVADAIPVDAATIHPRAGTVGHQAIGRTQEAVADAGLLGHRHQVDRVGRAQVRTVVRVDAVQDWNLHGALLYAIRYQELVACTKRMRKKSSAASVLGAP